MAFEDPPMTTPGARRHFLLALAASLFLVLLAGAAPAAAQLTGGLEGRYIHHVFERVVSGRAPVLIAEAWADPTSGVLWVRGRLRPLELDGDLRIVSKGTDDRPPLDTVKMRPSSSVVQRGAWLKQSHVWSRPEDGLADTGLKLVLQPRCVADCAIVAIEHYALPEAGGMQGATVTLDRVDAYFIEPGDVRTVFTR